MTTNRANKPESTTVTEPTWYDRWQLKRIASKRNRGQFAINAMAGKVSHVVEGNQ